MQPLVGVLMMNMGDVSSGMHNAILGVITYIGVVHIGRIVRVKSLGRFRAFDRLIAACLIALKGLVEKSFQRKLKDGWYEKLNEPLVMLSETGRAAAVITKGVDGLPYLEKFIVTSEAQGEGLGAAIWQVVNARYPSLYWRSRNTNPITPWYFQQADSSNRSGHWVVFTMGIENADQRERCVADSLARDSGWIAE